MLFLERKVGESIVTANGDIVFLILRAKNGNAKIGMIAPEGMGIYRAEIFEKLREKNASSNLIYTPDYKINEHWVDGVRVDKR